MAATAAGPASGVMMSWGRGVVRAAVASLAAGALLGSLAWLGTSPSGRAQRRVSLSQDVFSLSFPSRPADAVAGEPIAPPVTVQVESVRVPVTELTVVVSLAENASGATLSGSTEQSPDAGGAAVFSDLSIDTPGEAYTLVATLAGYPGYSATSEPFSVAPPESSSPASPNPPPAPAPETVTLAFGQQPASVAAGAVISPPVLVSLTRGGRYLPGRTVTLKLRGPTGVRLYGTVTATSAANGVATFGQLSVRRAGSGYRLLASADNAETAQSDVFDVWPGPAAMLAFTRQPGDGDAGSELSRQPQVSVQDQYGNTVDSAVPVKLDAATGGDLPTGRLSCAGGASQEARHGVVSFTGCTLDRAGDGYRLIATSPGLLAAKSQPFDIGRAGTGAGTGAGGGRWLGILVIIGALALAVAGAAGIYLLRQHRSGLRAQRVRAMPHPDAGTAEVTGGQPARAHTVRLEPHAVRGEPHLREEP